MRKAGDLILMSPHAHASWKAYYLSGSTELTMTQVKRRLQNQMIQNFSVLAIKTEEGNGKVRVGIWKIEEEKLSKEDKHISEDQPGIETAELQQNIHPDAEPVLNKMNGKLQIIEEETPDQQEEIQPSNSDIQVTPGETEQRAQEESDWQAAHIWPSRSNRLRSINIQSTVAPLVMHSVRFLLNIGLTN